MIAYSGTTPINTTFISDGTKTQLQTQFEAALTANGWTNISGHIFESAVTSQGLKIRVETDTVTPTNCCRFHLRTGTPNNLTAADYFLLPVSGSQFRLIVSKFQYFFFLSGITNAQRAVVCGGVPYLFPFLVFLLNGSPWCGWSHGNGTTDTDTTTLTASIRRVYSYGGGSGCVTNYAVVWNENTFGLNATLQRFGFVTRNMSGNVGIGGLQYEDGSWALEEPVLCWPTGIIDNANGTRHGQLWDAAIITKVYQSEDYRNIAGSNWMSITHNNTGSTSVQGSLLLLVP